LLKEGRGRLDKYFQISVEAFLILPKSRRVGKYSNISIQKINETTRNGALQRLADHMIAAGYARTGYSEAVISRENTYPTGLHTSGVGIAIPHADTEWTLRPALVIGLPDQPIDFKPMGGQGSQVQASIIFMLTLSDTSAHIGFLQAFSKIIEDQEVMNQLRQTQDVQLLLSRLRPEYSPESTSIPPSV
jgi:PTS system galactitol-specific IIA component